MARKFIKTQMKMFAAAPCQKPMNMKQRNMVSTCWERPSFEPPSGMYMYLQVSIYNSFYTPTVPKVIFIAYNISNTKHTP